MRIEPATVEAVDTVVEMWVRLAREQRSHDSHVLPEDNRERIREQFLRAATTGGLLIARTDEGDGDGPPGDAVGFVSFGPKPGSFAEDRDRGLVSNLYVRPDYRDRGIGGELLAAAERRLAADGFEAVTLEAMAANDDAIRFYDDRGYDRHRVVFEKRIGPGDGETGGSRES